MGEPTRCRDLAAETTPEARRLVAGSRPLQRRAGAEPVRRCLAAGLAILALGLGSCVAPGGTPKEYSWFEAPSQRDPWRKPIRDWQGRVRSRDPGPRLGPVPIGQESESLARAYAGFLEAEQRRQVQAVQEWIQAQARAHFVPDPGIDIWPTTDEVLEAGGDDCDGLAFLAHRLLRELGFEERDLYLAVVRRDSDALHHMVGLWFADGDDPWIIDPTGAMTTDLMRMSRVEGWEPLAVFSETEHYRALPQIAARPDERTRAVGSDRRQR